LLFFRTVVFRDRVHYLTCAAQTEREINRWKKMKDALDDKVMKLLRDREELEFKIKFGEERYARQCAASKLPKRKRKKARVAEKEEEEELEHVCEPVPVINDGTPKENFKSILTLINQRPVCPSARCPFNLYHFI